MFREDKERGLFKEPCFTKRWTSSSFKKHFQKTYFRF